MKKFIYFSIAALGLSTIACTKDNDGVKAEIEKTLPTIEITSMGLMNQVGPFNPQDSLIQVTFTGAITNNEAGTFDFAWYDANNTKLVDSVHFNSFSEPVSKATDSNSIAATWAPTTYANTQTFTGNLILKIKKYAAATTYSLRLYARTKDQQMATVSTSKFITKK